MMARLDHDGPTGDIIWHDAWDGFPASRQAITDVYTSGRVSNPVMVDRRLALDVRQRHPRATSDGPIPGGRHGVRRDLDHAPTVTARSTGRTTGR